MVNYATPSKFGETRLNIPYFQQMTFRSKIPKIIHTPLQFGGGVSINLIIFGVECELFWDF